MTNLYKTIGDYNNSGVIPLLYSIRDGIPYSFEVLSFALFFIFFFGNYYLVKSKTGRAKVFIALLSSSLITLVLSMYLLLMALISFKLILFWALLSIVSFILLIVSDNF